MHDLAIVGAGPVGATLACALAGTDVDLVVLDARAEGSAPRGDRSLALSHGARLIFERVGAWPALAATEGAVTPITAVDVSQARGFGNALLSATDVGLPALGYVVSYLALQRALDGAMRAAGIAVAFGEAVARVDATAAFARVHRGERDALAARMAVVADGGGDNVEGVERVRKAYGQVALIADVVRDAPADGVAFERFTTQGPVALLPKAGRYGLVWTMSPQHAEEALAWDDARFIAALAAHAGRRIGRIASVAARRTFPLTLEYAKPPALPRLAMLGNAAQTLHPIAGQGFNVGLRDAFELARIVADTPREAIGAPAMIDRYLRARRGDRMAGIALTHGLARLFASELAPVALTRGAGLALLGMLPPLRRTFTRAMLFGLR